MTPFIESTLDVLARRTGAGYDAKGPPFTEPTALAALAFCGHGRPHDAQPALDWLAGQQADDGSLGINAVERSPRWPTTLATLAWKSFMVGAADRTGATDYTDNIDAAVRWQLSVEGRPLPRNDLICHDTTLIGWPWVEGTHSWVEPTAWHVLALKATGHRSHPRTREAVRLLRDRLLPDGGCNYGNTVVLKQVLRPHLQPTGLAMIALLDEEDDGRIARSLDYLQANLSARTPAASLAYGILGLAAHGIVPPGADDWLAAQAARIESRRTAELGSALLALAALSARSPIVSLTQPASAAL